MNQPTEAPVQFDENGFALSYGYVQVYCASALAREYTGTKLERTFMGVSLSAGAYLDEPKLPKLKDRVICRTIEGTAWEHVPDYRSQIAYHTQTHQSVEITEVGNIAAGLTLLAPLTPFDKWDGKQWVTDVAERQAHEIQQTESHKRELLWIAREKIDIYQDAIDLGMATEVEKTKLTAWRKYRVELYQVDCTTAPDVKWPEQPK